MINIKGLDPEITKKAIPYYPAIVCYRGSIAHGMYVPNSNPNSIDDKDILAVTIGPQNIYIGLGKYEHTETFHDEYDIVTYEYRKFIGLLIKNNPNVLSTLWLEPKNYIYLSNAGEELIKNRELFVSKQAYHSFTGYAYSQLKRMTHFKFEGYMGEKRKSLVEKFGYDTKNAAHLIRLLRMGIEFLNEGVLYVERKDASQLLDIKHGLWTLDMVKTEAGRLFRRAEEAYDHSSLPSKPKVKQIEIMMMDELISELGFR